MLRTAEAVKQAGFVLFFSLDVVQWLKLLGVLGGRGVNERAGRLGVVQHAGEYASAAWCLALAGGLVKNGRQAQVLAARRWAKGAAGAGADEAGVGGCNGGAGGAVGRHGSAGRGEERVGHGDCAQPVPQARARRRRGGRLRGGDERAGAPGPVERGAVGVLLLLLLYIRQ